MERTNRRFPVTKGGNLCTKCVSRADPMYEVRILKEWATRKLLDSRVEDSLELRQLPTAHWE